MGCGGSKTTATTARSPRGQVQKQTRGRAPNARGKARNQGGKGRGGNSGNKKARAPVHEKGYKKRIRENLRQATAGDDIPLLDRCIVIFENNHLEDGEDLTDARNRMDFLLTRKEIRDACMRNHPVVLEKAIARVQASPYRNQLKPYVDRANYLLNNQNDHKMFRHDISQMEQSTISEIRSYHHPPPGVHETMIATYMILGYREEDLVDWTDVTALLGRYGKESMLREVQECDGRYVTDRTALRAKQYLNKYSLEEVRGVSNGAATFHAWSNQMISHYENKKSSAPLTPKETGRSKRGSQSQASQPDNRQKQQQNNKQKQQQDNKKKQEEERRKREEQKAKAAAEKQRQQQQPKQQAAQKQAKDQRNRDTKAASNTQKGNTNTTKAASKTQKKG